MSTQFYEVLREALLLPLDEQIQLRQALEDAEGKQAGLAFLPRVAGLNRNDQWVLPDLDASLPAEYLGELP